MQIPHQDDNKLIPLGVITTAHGIRGQVKIHSFTEVPTDITSYGPLFDKTGKPLSLKVHSWHQDILIASVAGITSRNDAEKLRGTEIFVPRSALPPTDEHEFYHQDLIGLAIEKPDGTPYGTITGIQNFGAGDLIVVKCANGEEEFFPFTRATFPVINLVKKSVVIDPPEVAGD